MMNNVGHFKPFYPSDVIKGHFHGYFYVWVRVRVRVSSMILKNTNTIL